MTPEYSVVNQSKDDKNVWQYRMCDECVIFDVWINLRVIIIEMVVVVQRCEFFHLSYGEDEEQIRMKILGFTSFIPTKSISRITCLVFHHSLNLKAINRSAADAIVALAELLKTVTSYQSTNIYITEKRKWRRNIETGWWARQEESPLSWLRGDKFYLFVVVLSIEIAQQTLFSILTKALNKRERNQVSVLHSQARETTLDRETDTHAESTTTRKHNWQSANASYANQWERTIIMNRERNSIPLIKCKKRASLLCVIQNRWIVWPIQIKYTLEIDSEEIICGSDVQARTVAIFIAVVVVVVIVAIMAISEQRTATIKAQQTKEESVAMTPLDDRAGERERERELWIEWSVEKKRNKLS